VTQRRAKGWQTSKRKGPATPFSRFFRLTLNQGKTSSWGKSGGIRSIDLQKLANETGAGVLRDKPENLDATFNTLINHLRNRYSLAFLSSNKKRDGALRKLKIDIMPAAQKSQGKLVVRGRKSYVAPRS